jgi:hypothetical protein
MTLESVGAKYELRRFEPLESRRGFVFSRFFRNLNFSCLNLENISACARYQRITD